jgi:hypothetical protein
MNKPDMPCADNRADCETQFKNSKIQDIYFGEQARSFMGAEALAKVYFANGVERWIAFGAGLAVLVPLDANPIQ